MKEIILFGAGQRALHCIEVVRSFGLDIHCIVDNSKKLQGSVLDGIPICAPHCINQEALIFITCKNKQDILAQLSEMGLDGNVISENDLPQLCYEKMNESNEFAVLTNQKEWTVILDLISKEHGFAKWGGTEIWSYNMVNQLLYKQKQTVLFMLRENMNEDTMSLPVQLFGVSVFTIKDIVKRLLCYLPCVIINNASQHLLLAGLVIKKIYPEKIRIITMLHTDLAQTYENAIRYDTWIDKYMCVSLKIKNKLIEDYHISRDKVCFKESMIIYDDSYEKKYHLDFLSPLSIGYACRLVKIQKQTHLLPKVIERMEQMRLNYILEIAGDGECYDDLLRYVRQHKLENRVRLLGQLNREEMLDYWKRQDVYLNISSFEGTSLAMLEAMSYGCVPVVTGVSGVDEFVTHHWNGCVVDVNHIEQAADEIAYLADRRSLLKEYGSICRKAVKERCSQEAYLSYMEHIMFNDGGKKC